MLNQPDESSNHTEQKDSGRLQTGKTVVHHKSDTDSDNEGSKQCKTCQSRVGAGTASRSLNHRAKVTVQRRANTKQKVVSLSFDKALELSGARPLTALAVEKLNSPNVERCKNRRTEQQKNEDIVSNVKRDYDTHTTKTREAFRDILEESNTLEKNLRPENPTGDKLERFCAAHEDKVVAFTYSRPETQCLDPPPIRLRQAWASPTPGRRHHSTSCQGTNTISGQEEKRRKRVKKKLHVEKLSQQAIDDAPSEDPECKRDRCDSGESSSPASEAKEFKKQDLPPKDGEGQKAGAKLEELQNRQEQNKTVVDINLPSAGINKHLNKSHSKRSPNKTVTEVPKSKGNISTTDDNVLTNLKQSADLKSQGMGDGENVHRKEESKQEPFSTTKLTSSASEVTPKRDVEYIEATRNKTTKKILGASLFSWPLFKKKFSQKGKQKKIDSKSATLSEKTPENSGVVKPSMADVLYQQGRVPVPQSLTEMFAASKPGTVLETNSHDQGQATDHLSAAEESQ